MQEKFPTIPPNSEYIQIFQVANCHWITVSNDCVESMQLHLPLSLPLGVSQLNV